MTDTPAPPPMPAPLPSSDRRGLRTLVRTRRHLALAVGSVLLVAGLVLAPTPIPVGWALILAGLYFLGRHSRTSRDWIRAVRRRFPRLSRGIDDRRHGLPGAIRRLLERTRPGD